MYNKHYIQKNIQNYTKLKEHKNMYKISIKSKSSNYKNNYFLIVGDLNL